MQKITAKPEVSKLKYRALIFMVFIVAASPSFAMQTGDKTLGTIRSSLVQRSTVPVYFPTYLPGDKNSTTQWLFPMLSLSKDGYSVELFREPDCDAQYCYEGSVSAVIEKSQKNVAEDGGEKTFLAHGISGTFYEADCNGAHCGDAHITWIKNGVRYIISENAGRLKELVLSANSMINRGVLH